MCVCASDRDRVCVVYCGKWMCYVCLCVYIRKYTTRVFMFLCCVRALVFMRDLTHARTRARANTLLMHDLCLCVQVTPSCLHARLKFIFFPTVFVLSPGYINLGRDAEVGDKETRSVEAMREKSYEVRVKNKAFPHSRS